jgi:UDP-N-acetylglucosamine acyltransferase
MQSGTRFAIHPTALVAGDAALGTDVIVGPYAIVESGATIGDRTQVAAYGYVSSGCHVGPDCEIHQGVVVGGPAQVRGATHEGGHLHIGARTVLREGVTVHRALRAGDTTVIGSDCMLLANSHVAHDCVLGDGVTVANGALLAGHVTIEDGAFLSGNVVVHQYVRIGRLSMIAGQARVSKDVPPYVIVIGDSKVCGVNVVGMRRAGMSADQRRTVSRLYAAVYRSRRNVSQAALSLEHLPPTVERDEWLAFLSASTRGLCAARQRGRAMLS